MYKCEQCGKQSKKYEVQLNRTKYKILKDNDGKKCGKAILFRKKVCIVCYNKYGPIIK